MPRIQSMSEPVPAPVSTSAELTRAKLTSAERSALRARAHALDPVIFIGTKGLSESVVAEIDRALSHHELIKIRVSGADQAERNTLLVAVCARTSAAPVQHIGKILVVFRPNPDAPKPAAAAKPAFTKPATQKSAAKKTQALTGSESPIPRTRAARPAPPPPPYRQRTSQSKRGRSAS